MAGALASACTTALALGGSRAQRGELGERLHAALYEERSPAARSFALAAANAGLPARGIRGDVTALWYGELDPLWKQSRAPLAGLTGYAALFCLEELARDHRLRVVYRGVHRLACGRALTHTLQGPPAALTRSPLERADRWPARLAGSILWIDASTGWQGLPPAARYAAAEQRPRAGSRMRADETLYSWVIA